jgi:2-oxoglutarate dehydrogenase E2 component (dihydrolipoamide succinyltransferase)
MHDDEPDIKISAWLKPDGAVVAIGEPVCELETDKATATLEAWKSGILRHLARAGDTVKRTKEFMRIAPLS